MANPPAPKSKPRSSSPKRAPGLGVAPPLRSTSACRGQAIRARADVFTARLAPSLKSGLRRVRWVDASQAVSGTKLSAADIPMRCATRFRASRDGTRRMGSARPVLHRHRNDAVEEHWSRGRSIRVLTFPWLTSRSSARRYRAGAQPRIPDLGDVPCHPQPLPDP